MGNNRRKARVALLSEKSQLPPKQSLLPELKYNTICGNSLIGPDIYEQGMLFGDEERDRINTFDWNSQTTGFGKIMKDGGFDCVIGNPPWGFDFTDTELAYLRGAFREMIVRMIDSFRFYVVRACSLIRPNGLLGMIVPDVLLYQVDNGKLPGSFFRTATIVDEEAYEAAIFHLTRKRAYDGEIPAVPNEPLPYSRSIFNAIFLLSKLARARSPLRIAAN